MGKLDQEEAEVEVIGRGQIMWRVSLLCYKFVLYSVGNEEPVKALKQDNRIKSEHQVKTLEAVVRQDQKSTGLGGFGSKMEKRCRFKTYVKGRLYMVW